MLTVEQAAAQYIKLCHKRSKNPRYHNLTMQQQAEKYFKILKRSVKKQHEIRENDTLKFNRYHNEATKKYLNKRRQQALAVLGNKCIACGFDDPRALQIDHINNDGAKERKQLTSNQINKKIIDGNILDYQLLCANCNQIKHKRQLKLNSRVAKLRQKALLSLGNCCVHCGYDDLLALEIDHINGGGKQERERLWLGGVYRRVLEIGTKEYQVLCSNCNQIKKHLNDEIYRKY